MYARGRWYDWRDSHMIKIEFHFSIRIYHLNGDEKKKKVEKKRLGVSLVDMVNGAIDKLSTSRRRSTVSNYRAALTSFTRLMGDGLTIDDLTQNTIEVWQHRLKEHGVKLNTISCYMRSLRSVINHCEVPPIAKSAFDTVYKGNTKTEKRSISSHDIQKLSTLKLKDGSRLQFARDLFLFSFFALGMPFVDVAFLRKDQIVNGYIEYLRHKTNQAIRVKVEPQMLRIINKYSKPDSPYVFPILIKGTMVEYETVRDIYNRQLRRLSKMAGLSRKLTSYVARHSWASMAYSQNVDLSVISKALGHTNSKTTMVYIREIDDNRIDKANHQLLGSIMKVAET